MPSRLSNLERMEGSSQINDTTSANGRASGNEAGTCSEEQEVCFVLQVTMDRQSVLPARHERP